MKRGIFSEKKRMFYKKVEEEHELFRYKMLASTPREVYERCNEIRFYECVFEYFWYCSSITEEDVEACLKEGSVLPSLWRLYLQHEYLKVDTWEDISEMVLVLKQQQKERALPLDGVDNAG